MDEQAAPAIVGAPRWSGRTRMPRFGIVKPIGALIVTGAIVTAKLFSGMGGDPLAFAPLASAVAVSVILAILYATSNGPVATWVGEDGVAIAARRWLGRGAGFRFGELADLELITSHAYVPPAPGETEPRHRALLYRLIARTRTGEIALAFDGEAPYREAGRYGDDDDRAPRTFTHLGADHTYWLARAIEDAWTAWRYASG